jgi:hypothetical protein
VSDFNKIVRIFLSCIIGFCFLILILKVIQGSEFGAWTMYVPLVIMGAVIIHIYLLLRGAALLRRLLSGRNETSSMNLSDPPGLSFQSPEVREVYAHMTSDEKARLHSLGCQMMGQIQVRFILPIFAIFFTCYLLWGQDRVNFLPLVLGALVMYFLLFISPQLLTIRRRSIEYLSETEWARSRGYTPARLRWKTFPWSR